MNDADILSMLHAPVAARHPAASPHPHPAEQPPQEAARGPPAELLIHTERKNPMLPPSLRPSVRPPIRGALP